MVKVVQNVGYLTVTSSLVAGLNSAKPMRIFFSRKIFVTSCSNHYPSGCYVLEVLQKTWYSAEGKRSLLYQCWAQDGLGLENALNHKTPVWCRRSLVPKRGEVPLGWVYQRAHMAHSHPWIQKIHSLRIALELVPLLWACESLWCSKNSSLNKKEFSRVQSWRFRSCRRPVQKFSWLIWRKSTAWHKTKGTISRMQALGDIHNMGWLTVL